jgi:hypothetical protein
MRGKHNLKNYVKKKKRKKKRKTSIAKRGGGTILMPFFPQILSLFSPFSHHHNDTPTLFVALMFHTCPLFFYSKLIPKSPTPPL